MENLYLLLVIVLAVLAIGDLIVGVSNDAVNFLNSAVGSKAISLRTIMILAGLGVAFGAFFSSGLMEVARKGIFNPGEFYFDEIILIFTAVMLTDILLLDFFNTLGMPTSTTVSIVFELLGAAVFMSLIKITSSSGEISDLINYINTSKAIQIISGIVLSIIVALTIGAIVQWICRIFLTYEFEKKPLWVSVLFSGIALSAISYFILMKGIKGTPWAGLKFDIIGGMKIKDFIELEVLKVSILNFIFWCGLSYSLIKFFKTNIYKVIIGVGTFALALAFAGNDLVNFIGVPIAAYQSYEAWISSGVNASQFSMEAMSAKVPTPAAFLILSGLVMVLTLWFSSKARKVMKTELDLSNQGYIKERFQPSLFSKFIVKFFQKISTILQNLLPEKLKKKIELQFSGSADQKKYVNDPEAPSFDMLRACVNLAVASILISIATSYKLPLSTTYVTFMVAMGTSLADRAWGRDSAVYRVSGVISVIAGWFLTAITAFIVSGIIVSLIHIGGFQAIAIILFIILLIVGKNFIAHRNEEMEVDRDKILKAESKSMKGVMEESSGNIIKFFKRVDLIFGNLIEGLSKHEITILKKGKKNIKRLNNEVEDLRENIFYFVKNLDEPSLSASNFYIVLLSDIQDLASDLEYIITKSHKHINNDHQKLKLSQIRDLREIHEFTKSIFKDSMETFDNNSVIEIEKILATRDKIKEMIQKKINAQIELTRKVETSPRNTTLYFNILLKTKDISKIKINIVEEFYNTYKQINGV